VQHPAPGPEQFCGDDLADPFVCEIEGSPVPCSTRGRTSSYMLAAYGPGISRARKIPDISIVLYGFHTDSTKYIVVEPSSFGRV
jgi:hypothetical protein